MSLDKKKLLEKIKTEMEGLAGKLPLTRLPQDIVPAEGNPEAEIMFIGEAAGYHESVERRPFVGLAGKLLSVTLADNDMKREEVWISNVVKTRPPDNRDPLPSEIEAFKPFLDREIEIIEPKIIVTLGRFSMRKFLGEEAKISQVHGQARWVNFKLSPRNMFKVVVLPMYHPAAALRSSTVKKMFEEDFKKLLKILAKIKGEGDKIEVTQVTQVTQVAQVSQEREEQLKLI